MHLHAPHIYHSHGYHTSATHACSPGRLPPLAADACGKAARDGTRSSARGTAAAGARAASGRAAPGSARRRGGGVQRRPARRARLHIRGERGGGKQAPVGRQRRAVVHQTGAVKCGQHAAAPRIQQRQARLRRRRQQDALPRQLTGVGAHARTRARPLLSAPKGPRLCGGCCQAGTHMRCVLVLAPGSWAARECARVCGRARGRGRTGLPARAPAHRHSGAWPRSTSGAAHAGASAAADPTANACTPAVPPRSSSSTAAVCASGPKATSTGAASRFLGPGRGRASLTPPARSSGSNGGACA